MTHHEHVAAQLVSLCDRANAFDFGPTLTPDSDMGALTEWLQRCDPNGCHAQDAFERDYGERAYHACLCTGNIKPEWKHAAEDCSLCDGEGAVEGAYTGLTYGGDIDAAWGAVREMLDD